VIADDNIYRGKWPLGRVTEVFMGKDGNVRSAKVKTAPTILTKANNQTVLLRRREDSLNEETEFNRKSSVKNDQEDLLSCLSIVTL